MISIEYFIGAVIAFVLIYFIGNRSIKQSDIDSLPTLKHRQSQIFEIVKPLLPPVNTIKTKKFVSQAMKHERSVNVRVIILGNKAFWIKDNVLYTANVDDDGINKESTEQVDTMHMSKVELDKMLFIVDQLTDGESK